MSRHKIVVSFLLLALALVMAACAAPPATPLPVPPTATALPPTPIPATATPIPATPTLEPTSVPSLTFTDGLGREVTLERAPARIVSLAPSNSELLFAVGAGDQVVGVTEYCTYPPDACAAKEVIGGFSAKSISVEKILALEPDVVLAAGKMHQPIIEALEQQNIPVIALTARTLDDVYANIELVGRLTGHEAEAATIVSDMQDQVEAITAKVATIPADQRLKVFWEVWDEPLMTTGPNTFIGQMIELAGGVNIFADVQEDYPKISAEEVVQRNPDVILGPSKHGDKLTVEQLAKRPGWAEIKAVQDGRIHLIDGDIVSRPGPRLSQALQTMASVLYPNLFQ